ncbi:hypothetical protein IW262DRAFT_1412176 [Armillaria fumosa]|nr:hypothetical protein IW262DRAFT_1412176 [Armillaria fumosa]
MTQTVLLTVNIASTATLLAHSLRTHYRWQDGILTRGCYCRNAEMYQDVPLKQCNRRANSIPCTRPTNVLISTSQRIQLASLKFPVTEALIPMCKQ